MKQKYYDVNVVDRQSFARFAGLLLKDFQDNPEEWENDRLEIFLEAIQAYANDLDGYYLNNYPDIDTNIPTWRAFSDILMGAKVYE